MRVLISMLAAAGIIGFSLASHADDAVTAPNKPKAAGRAIDDGTVTAPNKPKAAGRAIDEGPFGTEKPKKFGRQIDDGTVKASKKPKQHGREINADSSAVKTKPDPNKPGRAVQEEKK